MNNAVLKVSKTIVRHQRRFVAENEVVQETDERCVLAST